MGIEDVLLQQLQSILWTHPEAYAKSHAVIPQQKIIFNVLPHDNVECKELEAAWTAKGFLNITTIISNCPLILYFGGTYFIPGQNKQRKNWKVEEGWQGSVKGGGKGETEAHSTTNQFWAKAHTEAEDVEIGSVKMCTCWRCFMHLQRNIYPNMQTLVNVLQSALTQSFQTTLWETSYYSHLTDEVK